MPTAASPFSPARGRLLAWGVPAALVLLTLALPLIPAAITKESIDGGWYGSLAKPAWNPPNLVFGPVWTTLYAMMAAAACVVWTSRTRAAVGRPLALYAVQFVLNLLWSVLFFGLKLPAVAFAELVLLVVAVAGTLVLFWRVSRWAGLLLVPYLAWVCFAAVLNGCIAAMNP